MAAPRWDFAHRSSLRRAWPRCLRTLAWVCALVALATSSRAESDTARSSTAAAPPPEELVYLVGELRLEYAYAVEGVPDLKQIATLSVPLARQPEGFAAPAKGSRGEPVPIARAEGTAPEPFTASAIQAIDQAIADEFSRRGIVGVLVRPHPEDVGANTGRDLRPPGQTALRLVVIVSRLVEMHTIASGPRVPEGERIDNPVHERIKRNSPIQPGQRIRKAELEDYVDRLNRHPGRWVDTTVAAAAQPAGTQLQYLVAESRPWTAYFQVSDTGTSETTKWRERFGFSHTQVTGRDDVLQLDYITGGFSEVHATFGSYDAPIPFPWLQPDRLRGRIGGSWSSYDASEVGADESDFQGSQWNVGGRLTANVFQRGDLFADVFAGARFENVQADNEPVPGVHEDGKVDFFFPEIGASLERRTEISRFYASVSGEFNVSAIAGTDEDDLSGEQLGRSGLSETDVKIVRFEGGASFYMTPFFFPEKEPDSSLPSSALSNEISVSLRGQYTPDRLVPGLQAIAGGMETVRGYPQSHVAADTLYLGRVEYRVHVPRLFPVRDPIAVPWFGDFRVAPDHASGRPDWDFVVKAFLDYGRAEINDAVSQEESDVSTLTGTGIGTELLLAGNLVVHLDYGVALNRVNGLDKFNDEVHFSLALIW